MEPIEKYHRLYKGDEGNTDEKYIFTERLETRSKLFDWKIEPHIHPDIYQLLVMESGKLILQTSNEKQEFQSPFLLIIPSAVVHGFQYTVNCTGSITSLDNSVISDIVTKHESLVALFSELRIISLFDNEDIRKRILLIIENIDKEQNEFLLEKDGMINILLQELFIYIYRLWKIKHDSNTKDKNFRLYSYFREFQSILWNSNNKITVNEIAKQIGITTVHLNRICKQVADKPASKLINEQLIIKAKNYLIYTSYSISEIAYFLNFDYPNYFSRFFKKHTGITPNDFRGEKENSI